MSMLKAVKNSSWIKLKMKSGNVYLIESHWFLTTSASLAMEELRKYGVELSQGEDVHGYQTINELLSSEGKQESDIVWHTENIGSFNKDNWTQDFSGWKIDGF